MEVTENVARRTFDVQQLNAQRGVMEGLDPAGVEPFERQWSLKQMLLLGLKLAKAEIPAR